MDDIQRVDCFERLHQHLLRLDPDMQRRVAQQFVPFAYRTQDLTFFLTHLVALLSGIDDQTAEGRRRIRRFLIDVHEAVGGHAVETDETPPPELKPERLMVRDQGGLFEKPLRPAQHAALQVSVRNLGGLAPDGAGERPFGMAFDAELARRDCLPDRVAWVHGLVPCLTRLNVFRYLHRLGYPIVVPDSRCQNFFFRLGILRQAAATAAVQFETCRIGEAIALALQRSPGEIHLWVRAFTGSLPEVPARAALCGPTPRCEACDLRSYCDYARYRRPRAQGGTAPLPLAQWRPTERPRERLVQHGAQALEDSELLAIVLRTGAGKVNVLELARLLLGRFGSLQGIEDATLEELQSLHGIGRMKALELKAVFELGRRRLSDRMLPGDTLDSSEKVFNCYRARFSRQKQEEFILLMVNNKNQVIREELVSRGGLDASIVHPREVFKAAIRASAASVLFIHNHPSGDPTPSHDDFVITRRLEEAAELLQIKVLDHVIVGADSYYSFADGEVVTPPQAPKEETRASGAGTNLSALLAGSNPSALLAGSNPSALLAGSNPSALLAGSNRSALLDARAPSAPGAGGQGGGI
jgi:DNA repair protein RadC